MPGNGKRTCCICGFRKKNGKVVDNVSFHKFPANNTVREKWKKFCKLSDTDVVSNATICSQHFQDCDYLLPSLQINSKYSRHLKPFAVPTIFRIKKSSNDVADQGNSEIGTTVIQTIKISDTFCDERIEGPPAVTPTCSTPKRRRSSEPHCVNENEVEKNSRILDKCSQKSSEGIEEPVTPNYSTPKRRRFSEPRYVNEVATPDVETPRRASRVIKLFKSKIHEQSKKIKALQDSKRKLKKRINTLEQLVEHLKNEKLVSDTAMDSLKGLLPQSIQDLVDRQLKGRGKYSELLRSFALTLHFYSPKAYNYIRKVWKKLLPHPSTIRGWYRAVNGKPGFTQEALDAISLRVKDNFTKGKKTICNLVLDEMNIKEEVFKKGGQLYGAVDFGQNVLPDGEEEDIPKAKNALVFMIVPLNDSWKIPVGYFLIGGMSGQERANILRRCLEFVKETGAIVRSITFDGAAVNLNMCACLGANLNYFSDSFKPYIVLPNSDEKIYIFLDLCHAIKLVRNTIGDRKILMSDEGIIRWSYFEKLVERQSDEGLHLANKIRKKHLQFHNHKMNVRLAMETISESVEKSFIWLSQNEELFKNVGPTATFCHIFNDAVDILNCKNAFSKKKWKIPLNKDNYDDLKNYATQIVTYIQGLREDSGQEILKSNRKTGFLGFIINLQNIFKLYDDLFELGLNYLLTWKLSQDFLETFFSAIRARGGFNNNPNVLQFQSAYKRLLIRHELKEFDNGNILFDGIDILHVSCKKKNDIVNEHDEYNQDIVDCVQKSFDHDYINTLWQLSPFVETVVEYVSGYVAAKICKKISCQICLSHLTSEGDKPSLIKMKDKGPLLNPSFHIIKICQSTEKIIRQERNSLFKRNINQVLGNKVLRMIEVPFETEFMEEHIKTMDTFDNHRIQLFRLCVDSYLNIRLHHETKIMSEKDEYIRQKYCKLVLYNNQ